MYAPSRHGGKTPWMTSHSVGGSSSTGAKLSESVNLGSTEGLLGGSMKVFTMLSNALKRVAGKVCCGGGGDRLGGGDDFLGVVVLLFCL